MAAKPCFKTLVPLMLIGAWLPLRANEDFGCLYRGTDDSARVFARGGDYHTPYPGLSRSEDCRLLSVASGTVVVYRGEGARVKTTRVSDGPLIGKSKDQPGALAQSWSELKAILAGDQQLTQGSSRSGEAGDLASLLPEGRLGAPDHDLVWNLGASNGRLLKSFELLENGKAVYRQTGPAATLRIPVNLLAPGKNLTWKLQYGESQRQASFLVVSPDEVNQILSKPLTPSAEDKTSDVLTRAGQLLAAGYRWEAYRYLRDQLGEAK